MSHTITISDQAYEHLKHIMEIYSYNPKYRKHMYGKASVTEIKQNVIETALYTELNHTETDQEEFEEMREVE